MQLNQACTQVRRQSIIYSKEGARQSQKIVKAQKSEQVKSIQKAISQSLVAVSAALLLGTSQVQAQVYSPSLSQQTKDNEALFSKLKNLPKLEKLPEDTSKSPSELAVEQKRKEYTDAATKFEKQAQGQAKKPAEQPLKLSVPKILEEEQKQAPKPQAPAPSVEKSPSSKIPSPDTTTLNPNFPKATDSQQSKQLVKTDDKTKPTVTPAKEQTPTPPKMGAPEFPKPPVPQFKAPQTVAPPKAQSLIPVAVVGGLLIVGALVAVSRQDKTQAAQVLQAKGGDTAQPSQPSSSPPPPSEGGSPNGSGKPQNAVEAREWIENWRSKYANK